MVWEHITHIIYLTYLMVDWGQGTERPLDRLTAAQYVV